MAATYNLDERALTTVNNPPKILAEKESKQVGQVTSGLRGTLVTVCGIINAAGNSIPPYVIFPRVNFKEYMLNGAPPGTKGDAVKSGWMNTNVFNNVLIHFQKHTRCSVNNPVILIMDNHESHISITGLHFCKDNGIIILTIPPTPVTNYNPWIVVCTSLSRTTLIKQLMLGC